MPMNRRGLVTIGGMFGAAALVTANVEARAQEGQPAQPPKPSEARGKVTLYGEGHSSYFALSEMPEGTKLFHIDPRFNDRIGRLVLAAAEKGWVIRATYLHNVNGAGPVYDVRVEDFRAG
jgi:hypothetical protein